MLKSNDKKLVVYKDDFKPINVYGNGVKIAGYKEENFSSTTIEADDTYNDTLDCKVIGHHEQESHKAYWWNQLAELGNNVKIGYDFPTKQEDGTYYKHEAIAYVKVNTDIKQNHKYYYSFNRKWSSTHGSSACFVGDFSTRLTSKQHGNVSNIWYRLDIIVTADKDATQIMFGQGFSAANACDVYIKDVILIDLTAMFGEGKEPTIEQFKKMFPCDYYPYCAGEWRYANGGQYVNFNQLVRTDLFLSTTSGGITLINNNDGSLTFNGVCTVSIIHFWSSDTKIHPGSLNHKFIFIGIKQIDNNGIEFYDQNGFAANPRDRGTGVLFTKTTDTLSPHFRIIEGTVLDNYTIYPRIFDLTQMFGEGNEPTTVEEFKALYPNEYYEYVESSYEYTPGYYENGQVVQHIPDTAFDTPMPELPEEVKCVKDANINVSSKRIIKGFDGKDYTIPFELYGNGEVNDECEPCVLVDGEWKCRVTRRWWKCKIKDFEAITRQYSTSKNTYSFQARNRTYQIANALTEKERDKNFKSDIYKYNSSPINQTSINYTMCGYSLNNSIYFNDNDCESVEELKQKRKDNYICYVLETPTIELYDPIPVRTLPITTIINSDAQLECKIKTVDDAV